jgi:hypothetical protein
MANEKFLRIKGDLVEVVEERITKTVSLTDLAEEMNKEAGTCTPVLPMGCRYFFQKGDYTAFLIEQAPATRTISWSGTNYKLALPYVMFWVVFKGEYVDSGTTGKTRVFYRSSPFRSLKDSFSRPNLGNMNHRCLICTGRMSISGNSLAVKAESYIEEFWNSTFNGDINTNFDAAAGQIPEVATKEKWQKASAENPLFPLEADWLPFAGNIESLISELK